MADQEELNERLWLAAHKGSVEDAEKALDQGADINVQLHDRDIRATCTPLHRAAAAGHQGLVELLLDRGANVDRKDTEGRTALFLAAETGHKEVAELLLDRGANVDDRTSRGQAPLDRAVIGGHLKVAELLLDSGAQIDGNGRNIRPPLSKVAFNGHKDVVELLIDRGAKIDKKNWFSSTPLASAARAGHKEVVELLLDKGAKIDEKDAEGWTPLHIAAFRGHVEVVKLLLKKGALSSRRTNKGEVARELTKKKKVLDLLVHPPAVETREPGERQRRLKKDPPSETSQERQAVCKDFEAHIAYYLPGYVQRQSFSVHDLIYRPGKTQARLKEIEGNARAKVNESAAKRVEEAAQEMAASDKVPTTPNPSHDVSKAQQEPWRWIHLPANNKRWVKDLVDTLCVMGEIPLKDCDAIQEFIKRSYNDRKGSFLHQVPNGAAKGRNSTSFTIPYIDMEAEDYLDRENQIQLQEKEHFRHMNALEVQYASDILESRIKLLYRYTKRQEEKGNLAQVGKEGLDGVNPDLKDEEKSEQSSQGGRARKGSDTAEKIQNKNKEGMEDRVGVDEVLVDSAKPDQRRTKLLMVNQLWLWQIDSQTIITAFPDRWHRGSEDTLLQWILEADLDPRFGPSFLPVTGLDGLIAHIIRQCVRSIEVPYKCGLDEPCFEIFENSIANVAVLETERYNKFLDAIRWLETQTGGITTKGHTTELHGKTTQSQERPSKIQGETRPRRAVGERTDKQMTYETAVNKVADEAELLREIKDIRDEINMIKRVLSIQEDIVRKWFHWWNPDKSDSVKRDKRHRQKHFEDLDFDMGLGSRLKRVKELDEDAERVEKSLNHLLDLKQKQSNLDEARSSRSLADAADRRALETARQGILLTAFTLVTVIFVPLSFMVALFAVRIRDFPQDDKGLIWTSRSIAWRMFLGELSTGIGLIMIWMILPDSSLRLQASSIRRRIQLKLSRGATTQQETLQPNEVLVKVASPSQRGSNLGTSQERQRPTDPASFGSSTQAVGTVKGYFTSKARAVPHAGLENV